jgi:hypothetical protein
MKTLIYLSLFISLSSFAKHGKPELVARYAGNDAFNTPQGIYCFTSEPHATTEGIYLGCMDEQGYLMMKWNHTPGYKILTRTENYFSHPKEVEGKIGWYEFNEAGVQKVFEYKNSSLTEFKPKNLGTVFAMIDSFVAVKGGNYVYRLQEDAAKNLNFWKRDNTVSSLTLGENAYIFGPVTSMRGEMIAKIRKQTINENAPDELVTWDGTTYKTILKDRDADPTSPVKAFRHQYAYDQGVAALVITDAQGEAMVLIKNGVRTVVARAGVNLSSFDFFAPKLRNGLLVFRGMDLQKRKAVYTFENFQLKTLLTQGDVVQTDKGPAQVNYQNQDALLYGAPGIGPNGEIYQQATLTDLDSAMTLLGIGLLKFKKE